MPDLNKESTMQYTSDQIIDQLIDSYGPKEAMDIMAKLSGYESAPPLITDFVDGKDYLGPVLVDPSTGASELYGVWRSALKETYPNSYYSPYVNIVISGAIGCVDRDTEYLSPTGWKPIGEYDGGLVAQYHESGQISYVEPEYVNYPCEWFYHLTANSGIEQVLSSEHRVVYREPGSSKLSIALAEEVVAIHNKSPSGFSGKFLTTFTVEGSCDLTDEQLRVMVMTCVDGHSGNLKFNQKEKIKRAIKLLNNAGIKYTSEVKPNGYTWIRYKAPKEHEKLSDFAWKYGSNSLKVIVDEFVFWGKRKDDEYYIELKEEADFISYAGSASEYRTSMCFNENMKSYVIKFNRNQEVTLLKTTETHIEKIPSIDNRKYCFHVPTNMLVLRRGGNVFITGNTGKTTFSITGALYDLCKIMHLKDPHSKFSLIKSTVICYALINATKTLSSNVLYDQMIEWIESSPYFRTEMKRNLGKNSLFPKNISIMHGSRPSDVLGRAIVGAITSELNFQTKVKGQAKDNLTNIFRRLKSRFQDSGGTVPGHVWMDSSKTDAGSFLEVFIKNELATGSKATRVYDHALWEVKPHKFSKETFPLFIGDSTKDPFIITHPSQIAGLDECRIIQVPIDLKHDFELDVITSLRDIAGIANFRHHRFVGSVNKIQDSLSRSNPVTTEIITLDFFDRSQRLINFIEVDKLKKKKPIFIHIDLGLKNDFTGISATYVEGMTTVSRFLSHSGDRVSSRVPVFVTDFVMAIQAKKGQEVPIYKIKEFLFKLKHLGYNICVISTDGYQSTNLRQDLVLQGYNAELISVDRTKDPYTTFKQALLEDRYYGPKHVLLEKELSELIENDKKIDHPVDGSKDLADSAAGSVYSAHTYLIEKNASMGVDDYLHALDYKTPSGLLTRGSIYDTLYDESLIVDES